jgi:transposase
MPWRECSVMEERLRFVARLLEGEGMSELCREFGISRKTGYNIFNRYKDDGLEALSDRSRRPVRYANQLPDQIERLIVTCKREKRDHHGRDARSRLQKYVLSQPIAARSLEELSFRDLRGWLEELESSDALKPASCGRLLNDFCAALNRTLSSDPDSFPLIAERVRNALKSPPDAAAHLPVGELCVMDDR